MDSIQNINNENKLAELSDADGIDIKEVLFLLRKWAVLIAIVVAVTLLLVISYSLAIIPTYESEVSLAIEEPSQVSSVFGLNSNLGSDIMNNEIQLLISRSLAEEVVKNLLSREDGNLYLLKTRSYQPIGVRKFFRGIWAFINGNEDELPVYDDYKSVLIITFNEIVKSFQRQLKVENINKTNVLKISFKSNDPQEAALIVNTVARTYQSQDQEWSAGEIINLRSFLSEQLQNVELNLNRIEDSLKVFKENEQIYALDGNAKLMLDQLRQVETRYNNIKAELSILQERKRYVTSKLSEEEKTLTSKLLNSMDNRLFALRKQIAQNEADLVKNTSLYGENHEAVRTIQRKITQLKQDLKSQTNILIAQGTSVADPLKYRQALIDTALAYESLEASLQPRLEQYQELVDKYSEELNTLPAKSLQFARLERDRSVLAETYALMRQKFEEARISEASESGKVRIIDLALPNSDRIKPSIKLNALIGLVIGAGLAFIIVIFLEKYNTTIKSVKEIEDRGLTVLGIIPAIDYRSKKDILGAGDTQNIGRRLITSEDPKSPISEAYRSLRTNLMYTSDAKANKSIIISSPNQGEGKSTTIANLAIAYANMGKQTLLIDADLRRPVVHNYFNINRDPGLVHYLTGVSESYFNLIHSTGIGNLSVLTSGVTPPNPSELLGSERMSDLIKKLEKDWDIILIDSPPLVAVTDAMLISKAIDRLVIVVKAGQTDNESLTRTLSIINNIGVKLVGIVLNNLSSRHSYQSYYYHNQYYHQDEKSNN